VQLQPLLRFRMSAGFRDVWGGVERVARENPKLVDFVRDEVAPGVRSVPASWRSRRSATGATGAGTGRGSRPSWSGCSTAATSRRPAATRSSSGSTTCPTGCCPGSVLDQPTPSPEDSVIGLVRRAAQALGVAGEYSLRDYFRTPPGHDPRCHRPPGGGRRADPGGPSRVRIAHRTTSGTRPRCRAGSTPGRCSARSIR
jgi:hypothetical protein